MSIPLTPNVSFTCTARSLSGLKALVLPASDELVIMQGAPVGRLFSVTFNQVQGSLADGDLLVNEADSGDAYRIRGVKHIRTPLMAHTHCLAERGGAK